MILLGQDNCHLTIAREVVESGPNSPIVSNTKLGWVVHGNSQALKKSGGRRICHVYGS